MEKITELYESYLSKDKEERRINERIIEGSSSTQFDDGNIPKAKPSDGNLILRACQKGKVTKRDGVINIRGRYYTPNTGR